MKTLKTLTAVVAVVATLGACSNLQNGQYGQLGGALLGGAGGGALGSQFGGGKGNTAMTIGGTLLGALLGSELGQGYDRTNQMWNERQRGQMGQMQYGQYPLQAPNTGAFLYSPNTSQTGYYYQQEDPRMYSPYYPNVRGGR